MSPGTVPVRSLFDGFHQSGLSPWAVLPHSGLIGPGSLGQTRRSILPPRGSTGQGLSIGPVPGPTGGGFPRLRFPPHQARRYIPPAGASLVMDSSQIRPGGSCPRPGPPLIGVPSPRGSLVGPFRPGSNERNPRFSRVGAPSVRSGSRKGPDFAPDSPPSTLGAGIMPGRMHRMDRPTPRFSSRTVHSGPQLLKTGGSAHRDRRSGPTCIRLIGAAAADRLASGLSDRRSGPTCIRWRPMAARMMIEGRRGGPTRAWRPARRPV